MLIKYFLICGFEVFYPFWWSEETVMNLFPKLINNFTQYTILTNRNASVSFLTRSPSSGWRCLSAALLPSSSSCCSAVWLNLRRAELCIWTAALSVFTHTSCANTTHTYDQMRWVHAIKTSGKNLHECNVRLKWQKVVVTGSFVFLFLLW